MCHFSSSFVTTSETMDLSHVLSWTQDTTEKKFIYNSFIFCVMWFLRQLMPHMNLICSCYYQISITTSFITVKSLCVVVMLLPSITVLPWGRYVYTYCSFLCVRMLKYVRFKRILSAKKTVLKNL
jgi:hypothetical protein